MSGRRRSKLLQAESHWPDLSRNYGELAIPAVRAAVMAQTDAVASRASDAEDRAETESEPSSKDRQEGRPRSST
jgi:hypothetical protein